MQHSSLQGGGQPSRPATPVNGHLMVMADGTNKYFSSSSAHGQKQLIDLTESRWFLALFIGLAVVSLLNIALSTWIIKSLHIGQTGLGDGHLGVLKKGVSLRESVQFDGPVKAQLIQATGSGSPLIIESNAAGFSLRGPKDQDGKSAAELTLANNKLEVQTNSFVVKSRTPDDEAFTSNEEKNNVLFEVSPDQVTTTTSSMSKFIAPTLGGLRIAETLESSLIEGDLNHNLR